jgi:hypothetical protein
LRELFVGRCNLDGLLERRPNGADALDWVTPGFLIYKSLTRTAAHLCGLRRSNI